MSENNKNFVKSILDYFQIAKLQWDMYNQFVILTENPKEAERQTCIFMRALLGPQKDDSGENK